MFLSAFKRFKYNFLHFRFIRYICLFQLEGDAIDNFYYYFYYSNAYHRDNRISEKSRLRYLWSPVISSKKTQFFISA